MKIHKWAETLNSSFSELPQAIIAVMVDAFLPWANSTQISVGAAFSGIVEISPLRLASGYDVFAEGTLAPLFSIQHKFPAKFPNLQNEIILLIVTHLNRRLISAPVLPTY